MELGLGSVDLAKNRFLSQFEEGEQFAPDLTHFATLQALYKKVLETFHLITPDNSFSFNDCTYDRLTLLQNGFIDWIESNRSILQGIIAIPSLERLKRDPIRFVSYLLQKLGLKQKRVGKSEDGKYQIDSERAHLLLTLLERRKKGLLGKQHPLIILKNKEKQSVHPEMFSEFLRK